MTTQWIVGNASDIGSGQIQAGNNTSTAFACSTYVQSNGNGATTGSTIRVSGTMSNYSAHVSVNGITGASTFRIYVSTSTAGNETFSVAGGATGTFTDSTHSDIFTAPELVWQKITGGAGGTSLQADWLYSMYAPASGDYVKYSTGVGQWQPSAAGTFYCPICASPYAGSQPFTTAAPVTITFREAGTLKDLSVQIGSGNNATTTTTTINSYVGGAQGNLAISISAGADGTFEDTSHTDTISSGTTVCMQVILGDTSGVRMLIQPSFVPSAGGYPLVRANWGVDAIGTNSTVYSMIGGGNGYVATVGKTQVPLQFAAESHHLYCYVSANTSTVLATTLNTVKNSANGNGILSIAAGATGAFEDTVNSDTYNGSTDTIGLGATNSDLVGGPTIPVMGIHLAPYSAAPSRGARAWAVP